MEILVPISLGELYDKILILQIKLNKIKDQEKLINVINEWNLLVGISEKYPIDDELYFQLKKVNTDLWIVEDQLRIKEKNNE